MIEIAALFIYPVKSCRGIAVRETRLGSRGFQHDREFVVIDEAGTCLTQRTVPELATVAAALADGALVLTSGDRPELRIPMLVDPDAQHRRSVTIFGENVMADDAGNEAAEWFSSLLCKPARLVRIGALSSRHAPIAGTVGGQTPFGYRSDISFTDAFPTLIVSEESLADLNLRSSAPIPADRFRANIVVRGGAAYAENTWTVLRSGNISFRSAEPCQRCVITTIHQATGRADGPEPLRTLATYRRVAEGEGVIFGQYVVHRGEGALRVGEYLTIDHDEQ